ncbi:hypothetical protein NVV31_22465 [Cytobacillus firmus]|uniref:hypothetical protein n=1 Tax=Cytobacillus firmus TaxID=1399 RepID=UPI0021C6F330|nr:hypothetical protein [Cytobacillus firmus]MCU1808139.1 hypothetical protein [Cytobacillus firmus]
MKFLFDFSRENKIPIELIYINDAGKLTHRAVVVRNFTSEVILTLDIRKQQFRTFKRANILSAAKQRRGWKVANNI